jgi:hypothetical protein
MTLCSLIYSNEQKHVAIPQTGLTVCPLTLNLLAPTTVGARIEP